MQIKIYIICVTLSCVCMDTLGLYWDIPLVVTKSGIIIGSEVSYNNTKVYRYRSVPYARPPVGDLRFERTQPVEHFGIRIDPSLPPNCWQRFPFDVPWSDNAPGMDEDCLFLNIWAPKGAIRNPKAVMVWIHGGGFATGSTRLPLYDGHVLAAVGDVVVVTVNYRLDIFGFLSTSSDEAPGNMGLFDILEALKWVNENIGVFGGDKNRITLFGQSAGSYATAYLTVSPLAEGLFQQIIMESGAQDDYVTEGGDTRERNENLAQKVAVALNCATNETTIQNSPETVVRCLRKKGPKEITDAVFSASDEAPVNFYPVYGDSLLPTTLFEAVKQGRAHKVRIMVGNVQDEASINLGALQPQVFGVYGEKNPNVNVTYAKYLVRNDLRAYNRSGEIADHYLQGVRENDYKTARMQAYYAIGDFISFCPPLYFAEYMSDRGYVLYYFYYDHPTKNTRFAPWTGVTHTIEVPFVFGRPLDSANYTEPEKEFSVRVIRYWTDFAKYGKPSQTWEKFSRNNTYAEILRINESYPNYIVEHFNNCKYLRDYYYF